MTIGQACYGQPLPNLVGGSGITITTDGGNWSNIAMDLSTNKEFQDLKKKIEGIEKRLAILVPNIGLQEKFAALQEAYNHYKVIEKLVNDQSKNRE